LRKASWGVIKYTAYVYINLSIMSHK
jgi:hypothetical protein